MIGGKVELEDVVEVLVVLVDVVEEVVGGAVVVLLELDVGGDVQDPVCTSM